MVDLNSYIMSCNLYFIGANNAKGDGELQLSLTHAWHPDTCPCPVGSVLQCCNEIAIEIGWKQLYLWVIRILKRTKWRQKWFYLKSIFRKGITNLNQPISNYRQFNYLFVTQKTSSKLVALKYGKPWKQFNLDNIQQISSRLFTSLWWVRWFNLLEIVYKQAVTVLIHFIQIITEKIVHT